MDWYSATEEAYKKGYEFGYEHGKRDAVVHSEWKPYYDHFTKRQVGWICANCSGVQDDLSNGDTDYCPNCGAKMDLED